MINDNGVKFSENNFGTSYGSEYTAGYKTPTHLKRAITFNNFKQFLEDY